MAKQKLGGTEPLRYGAPITSIPSKVGTSSSPDQQAISLIFDGLQVSASGNAGRVVAEPLTIAVSRPDRPSREKLAVDIFCDGFITNDNGGRFMVSEISNR